MRNRHKQEGRSYEKIKCDYCDHETTRRERSKMKRHVASVHLKIKSLAFDQCTYSTSYKWSLEDHIKVVHDEFKIKCPFCEVTSSTQGNMKQHVESVHDKNKTFDCKLCPVKFYARAAIEHHTKSIHIKDFKCQKCPYKTSTARTLRLHIKAIHDKIKDFVCKLCSYANSTLRGLKLHVAEKHDLMKDYMCHHCNYSTSLGSRLKIHLQRKHKSE